MTESNLSDDVQGSTNMRFIKRASWLRARNYCVAHGVPIEDESDQELVLIISMASFKTLPASLRGQFNLVPSKKDVRDFNALRRLRGLAPDTQQVKQWPLSDEEDERLVRCLIPDHLLLRV